MVSLEEQRLYTKGLEGDLQKTRQRLLNAESIVKVTKIANEAMQATVDYWSSFDDEENAVPSSAAPAVFSSTVVFSTDQLPNIPEQQNNGQPPQASSSSI